MKQAHQVLMWSGMAALVVLAVFLVFIKAQAQQAADTQPKQAQEIVLEPEGAQEREQAVGEEEVVLEGEVPEIEAGTAPEEVVAEVQGETTEEPTVREEVFDHAAADEDPRRAMDFSGRVGSIRVATFPAGAKVFINQEYLGVTSQTFRNLPAGTALVRLERGRYQTWEEEVFIPPDRIAHVEVELVKVY